MTSANNEANFWTRILGAFGTTIVGATVLLLVGSAFSCTIYKWMIASNFSEARRLAEASRNAFGGSGYCFEECSKLGLHQDEYNSKVESAKRKLEAIQRDSPIQFKLGVNYPIRTEDPFIQREGEALYVIGYINRSNNSPSLLKAKDIVEMIKENPSYLYDYHCNLRTSNNFKLTKVSDYAYNTRNKYILAQEECEKSEKTFDLIIYNKEIDQVYIAKCTLFADLFRDALNAALGEGFFNNDHEDHLRDVENFLRRQGSDV